MADPYSTKWIAYKPLRPEAALRLFCLPWAGGNSTAFNRWRELPESIEVCAIELPARMSRRAEPALSTVAEIARETAAALNALGLLRSKPFALFGHSLGALVAFELARLLADEYDAPPCRLIVSGASPPEYHNGRPDGGGRSVSGMSRDELVQYLVEKGGIPQQLAAEPEVLDFYLPPIRADYLAYESYLFVPPDASEDDNDAGERTADSAIDEKEEEANSAINSAAAARKPSLAVPMLVLGGDSDPGVPRERLKGWLLHTSSGACACEVKVYPGGHFFVKPDQQHAAVIKDVAEALTADIEEAARGLAAR